MVVSYILAALTIFIFILRVFYGFSELKDKNLKNSRKWFLFSIILMMMFFYCLPIKQDEDTFTLNKIPNETVYYKVQKDSETGFIIEYLKDNELVQLNADKYKIIYNAETQPYLEEKTHKDIYGITLHTEVTIHLKSEWLLNYDLVNHDLVNVSKKYKKYRL